MVLSYPIVLSLDAPGYVVYIPDFDIYTQGYSLTEAKEMARDAIGLIAIDMQGEGKEFPQPSPVASVAKSSPDDLVIVVDVDVDFEK